MSCRTSASRLVNAPAPFGPVRIGAPRGATVRWPHRRTVPSPAARIPQAPLYLRQWLLRVNARRRRTPSPAGSAPAPSAAAPWRIRPAQSAGRRALTPPAGDADSTFARGNGCRKYEPYCAGDAAQTLCGLLSLLERSLLEVDINGGASNGPTVLDAPTAATSSSEPAVARSSRSLARATSPRARWNAAWVRTASGCCSSPFSSCPASPAGLAGPAKSASRMIAAARCGMPRSKWRAASMSCASASCQRPAAVRMPP